MRRILLLGRLGERFQIQIDRYHYSECPAVGALRRFWVLRVCVQLSLPEFLGTLMGAVRSLASFDSFLSVCFHCLLMSKYLAT